MSTINPVSASSSSLSTGSARATITGIKAVSASGHSFGHGYAMVGGATLPAGAMDDFSCWQPGLADPLMARYVNAAYSTLNTGLQRVWVTSTVPQELKDGSGKSIWKRAAYAGIEVDFPAIPPGSYGIHSHAQLEAWDTTFRTPVTLSGGLPELFSSDPTGVPATITLSSIPVDWPAAPFYLVISREQTDQELFLVQYITGTNVTGRRGVASAMPAHSNGASVQVAEISPYEPGRTVNVRMKANRVNYVKNPSFETSVAFVGANNASFTRTNSVTTKKWGAYALSVQADSSADAFAMELLELNQSTQMAWSAWVLSPSATWLDMTKMGLQEVTSGGTLGRLIGSGTGVTPIAANTWTQVKGTARIPFDWGSETAFLMRPPSNTSGSAWDLSHLLYYDGLLVEEGNDTGDYFDGSFTGEDYLWETDDTGITHPHESRSYYYEGIREKAYRVEQTVKQWIPFGASYRIRYGTSPIQ